MRYRKKPVVIEAVQYTGTLMNVVELAAFMKQEIIANEGKLEIPTLEGVMTASQGDFIIKGIHGEFYPCKPDIFEQTYEAVTDEQ